MTNMIKMDFGKNGLQPVEKVRSVLKEYIGSGRFIREAGQAAIALIKERTHKGVGASGSPFTPYSATYQQSKGEGTVNLSDSGQMLNDLVFEVQSPTQGAVTVRGSSAERAAAHVEGKGNLPKRDFISINPGSPEEQKLIKTMREKLQRELKRAIG